MVFRAFVGSCDPKLEWSVDRTNCLYHSTRVNLYNHQHLLLNLQMPYHNQAFSHQWTLLWLQLWSRWLSACFVSILFICQLFQSHFSRSFENPQVGGQKILKATNDIWRCRDMVTLSTLLSAACDRWIPQIPSKNAELWFYLSLSQQIVEQTVGLLMTYDAAAFMWNHYIDVCVCVRVCVCVCNILR